MLERQASPHRDPLPHTRFVFTYNDELDPRDRCFFREYSHFSFTRLAFTDAPEPLYVAVDLDGTAYTYDLDREGEEASHPRSLPGTSLVAVINKVVRVGSSIYTVGGPRRVHQRKSNGIWRNITSDLPVPDAFLEMKPNLVDFFWFDLSGFSETDMYAVGGAGELWHYDGNRWERLRFPSNERLYNVCCAGDGKVYVGGNMGSLYVGRGHRWNKVHEGQLAMSFKDLAWFADRLWCGSDYGLWELAGKEFVRANVPSNVQLVSGALDVSPNGQLLLTAGPGGAAVFDGSNWEVLFSSYS